MYLFAANHTPFHPVTHHLTCRKAFAFNLSIGECKPLCGQWSPYSDVENRVSNAVVIVSGAVAIISGSIVLILSCIRCKKL